jgi:hypothetical protein
MAEYQKVQQLKFNIAGPCSPGKHYMLNALTRLPTAKYLSTNDAYFVLHAPRQSGKTTAIGALIDEINSEEQFYAVYCSIEEMSCTPDTNTCIYGIENEIRNCIIESIPKFSQMISDVPLSKYPLSTIRESLTQFSKILDRKLILFIDEADSLSGDAMISFLRQLRYGYIRRSWGFPFPSSVALIGMRNIRDYKIYIRDEEASLGTSSPFNIIDDT